MGNSDSIFEDNSASLIELKNESSSNDIIFINDEYTKETEQNKNN